jgi:hypothetical protein
LAANYKHLVMGVFMANPTQVTPSLFFFANPTQGTQVMTNLP